VSATKSFILALLSALQTGQILIDPKQEITGGEKNNQIPLAAPMFQTTEGREKQINHLQLNGFAVFINNY